MCMVGHAFAGEDGLLVEELAGWGQIGESFESHGSESIGHSGVSDSL